VAEFKDENGNEWSIRIDVNQIRKVRSVTGIDLGKMFTQEGLLELLDVEKLVDVLACLLEPQIVAKQLDATKFAEAICGDAIERAAEALIMAGADFLPQSRAKIARALWEKLKAAGEVVQAKAQQEIDSLQLPASGS